jgi:hypothetical protein
MSPVNEGACLSRVLATYESQIEFTTEDIIHERYVASKRILRGGIGEGKNEGKDRRGEERKWYNPVQHGRNSFNIRKFAKMGNRRLSAFPPLNNFSR